MEALLQTYEATDEELFSFIVTLQVFDFSRSPMGFQEVQEISGAFQRDPRDF